MQIVNFSDARNHLKKLCDEVRRSRVPARIRRKGGDVVVVAAEDWEAIEETIHVASIPGALGRIKGADDYKPLDPVTRQALEELIKK